MRKWLVPSVAVAICGGTAVARHFEFVPPSPFQFEGRPVGGAAAAPVAPAYLTGSRIAVLDAGAAIAIDADSGKLLHVDAAGALVDELMIGTGAGMLAYDPIAKLAYIADRAGDRVIVVAVADKLTAKTSWAVPREPYGIALSPDRKSVYVTAIADRAFVELDASTGRVLHATAIDKEPRGLAIAPDGAHAMIAHLATGGVTEIALADRTVKTRALTVRTTLQIARAAFAVTYLDANLALVPFQRSEPQPSPQQFESGGHYGGNDESPPITTELGFLGKEQHQVEATTNLELPRSLVRDGARDVVYVAGLGDDQIVRIAKGSQVDAAAGGALSLASKQKCGPEGMAVAGDGTLFVWCSFSRTIARVPVTARGMGKPVIPATALVASSMDAVKHEGMELFHTADDNISSFGSIACASCHLDGRADGLSWRIHGENLQTPMLGGRLADTAPFKWDGGAKDLATSVRATVERLGGGGLAKRHVAALVSYLETMSPVRAPTGDATRIARGKGLFESAELGCTQCHDGAAYTDRETHKLAKGTTAMDTPSLRGLAASAPYFHDGSAATLEALLRERGSVHAMADASRTLNDGQVRDLVAFLESL